MRNLKEWLRLFKDNVNEKRCLRKLDAKIKNIDW